MCLHVDAVVGLSAETILIRSARWGLDVSVESDPNGQGTVIHHDAGEDELAAFLEELGLLSLFSQLPP